MNKNISTKKYILVYRNLRIYYLGRYNGVLDCVDNKEDAVVFTKKEAEDIHLILANKRFWHIEEFNQEGA